VLHDPVLLVTGDGRVLCTNRRARELIGRDAAGEPLAQVLLDSDEKTAGYLRLCSRTRDSVPALLTLRTPTGPAKLRCDGALLEPRTGDTPPLLLLELRPKARSVERFLLINEKLAELTREVQHRKGVETELQRQAEELRRSNAELEDFAYIASHDLKEPLRGISTFAGLLREEHASELGEEARRKIATIEALAMRMYMLLEALLEYSRVGRGELLMEPTDLNAVLEQVLDTLRPRLEEDRAVVQAGELPRICCNSMLMALRR
jgi:signal transduction histidine kinase